MEEELDNMVMIYKYPLNEKIVSEFAKRGLELTNADIEIDIQKLLRDNLIKYKNRLVDNWFGKDYKLMVEIYVYEVNLLRAQQLINEYMNYNGEYYYDEINEEREENNGETSDNI